VALLRRQPAATFPVVEQDLLGDVYPLAISQLVTGPALDSILAFFGALVEADPEIATRVIPSLTTAYEKAPRGEASPGNVARCLAQVVKSNIGVAAATIAQFSKHVKVSGYDTAGCIGAELVSRTRRQSLRRWSSASSWLVSLGASCRHFWGVRSVR
jgi:hypothetical protein